MDNYLSHFVAFLVGGGAAAAGQYMADKYTDQRKQKELASATKSNFESIQNLMPSLIAEMRKDMKLEGYETVREFVLLRGRSISFSSDRKRFCYFENEHDDLIGKVHILENAGLVADVTTKTAPIYRMAEHFVQWLKSK